MFVWRLDHYSFLLYNCFPYENVYNVINTEVWS